MPPPTPRCYELLIKKACGKLNVPSVPSRLSILTQPLNGRPPCHYCSQCGRGCSTHSNFSSPSVLIPPALKTGRLKIITNAMAREVTVDAAGLADGVTYVDKSIVARQPRPRPHRRAGGERVRVGAHPAQLEVVEVPAGPRQLERRASAST